MNPLTILTGDCREILKTLPDESVNCVVTSPPYWGLRDYGVPGQLGLEPTLDEYIKTMTGVFEEVRRVLRKDGTCWINLGDSYAGGGGFSPDSPSNVNGAKQTTNRGSTKGTIKPTCGLKPKDLCGVPWRLAFALQAAGWWLRCDIIWHKPNPMPESCQDRPTHAHEYIFLMTKSAKYWYDNEAIREPHQDAAVVNGKYTKSGISADDYEERKWIESCDGSKGNRPPVTMKNREYNPAGRNKRSVWTVPSQAYPGAHFATFPEKLITPCILAGCPAQTCPKCGAPWVRVVEKKGGTIGQSWHDHGNDSVEGASQGSTDRASRMQDGTYKVETLGWRPTCECAGVDDRPGLVFEQQHPEFIPIPGTVLDPFAGSGTTGKVALEYGRHAILIELNPAYVTQANQRTETTIGFPLA